MFIYIAQVNRDYCRIGVRTRTGLDGQRKTCGSLSIKLGAVYNRNNTRRSINVECTGTVASSYRISDRVTVRIIICSCNCIIDVINRCAVGCVLGY